MQFSIQQRLLIFIGAMVAGLIGWFVFASFAPTEAEATACFSTGAARDSALPITPTFPRGAIVRVPGLGCGQQSDADSWSLVSSYYCWAGARGGSRCGTFGSGSQSALQTGRSRFNSFMARSTAPSNAQQVTVFWTGLCEYSGRVEIYAIDLDPTAPNYGRVNLGSLTNPGGVTRSATYAYNARWRNGASQYGPNIWKSQMTIVAEATDAAGSEMSCRVRVASPNGALMSFFEDADSTNSFAESQNGFNHANWQSQTKNYLGPGDGASGAYALYSGLRIGGSAPDLEYAIPFQARCDITGPRRTTLRIYDGDHPSRGVDGTGRSAGPLQGSIPYMRLYREDTRTAVPLTGNGFTNATTVEVRIGNDQYDDYYFTIEPGVRYTWVFWNIQANNGVQVWMPFSEVHATYGCPTWDHTPTIERGTGGSTIGVGRDISVRPRNRNVGSGTGPGYLLRVRAADATTRAYVTPVSLAGGTVVSTSRDSIQWDRRSAGLGGGSSWAPGYPRYRVSNSTPHGTRLCFHALVSPDSPSRSSWQYTGTTCWTVSNLTYRYVPLTPSATTSLPRFYAGSRFGMTGVVRNDGNGTGPTYRQDFYETSPHVSGSTASYTSQPGLPAPAPNDSRRNTTASNRWLISSSAPHNTPVTCRNRVRPASGTSPPSAPRTFDGDESAYRIPCFRVYNQRFNIETVTASDVNFSPTTVLPTTSFTADVDVCNALAASAVAPATRGVAPSVNVRIVADTNVSGATRSYTQNINFGAANCFETGVGGIPSFTGTVSSTAGLGDQACVRILINKDRGFSDGYQTVGSQNVRFCINVAEQGAVQVRDNGVWAGGDFDSSPTGYGTPWCSVSSGSRQDGFITGARLGSFGSYAEYIVGATWDITNWGSTSVTGSRLHIANTPGSGRLNSEGLCFTNLNTYLSRDTSVAGISTFNGGFPGSDGQFIYTGVSDLTINAQTIPIGRQITIISDRDVIIRGDIEYASGPMTRDQLPSLIIVTTGNIDIDRRVERLDGIFHAEGVINTCEINPGIAPAQLDATRCSNQLTINGMFVAEDIEFRRTYGGLSGNNPNGGRAPAEIFENTAEVYLADHYMLSDYEPDLTIDRLIDLPPALN